MAAEPPPPLPPDDAAMRAAGFRSGFPFNIAINISSWFLGRLKPPRAAGGKLGGEKKKQDKHC